MLKEIPGMEEAMQEARVLQYDTRKYPFAKIIAAALQCKELEKLHLYEMAKYRKNDQAISDAISFDRNFELRNRLKLIPDGHIFYKVYNAFIKNEVTPIFQAIRYNSHPSFRVHMANTPSVSAWHTDYEVTGRTDQITVWVPLVDAFSTNTIHVETDYGKLNYKPVPVKYGEALLFDGNFLRHGSVRNFTNVSRLSFDFRFAPKPEVLKQFFKRTNLSIDALSLLGPGAKNY